MINKAFNGYGLGLTDSLVEASKKVVEDAAAYKKFFDGVLKKFGVTSPAELDDAKKKEFFDYIDKNWNGESESGKDGAKEEVKEGELPPALKKAIAKKKGEDDSEDEDKEDVKEGELPPALQKAIDKKKGKEDDSEDKED